VIGKCEDKCLLSFSLLCQRCMSRILKMLDSKRKKNCWAYDLHLHLIHSSNFAAHLQHSVWVQHSNSMINQVIPPTSSHLLSYYFYLSCEFQYNQHVKEHRTGLFHTICLQMLWFLAYGFENSKCCLSVNNCLLHWVNDFDILQFSLEGLVAWTNLRINLVVLSPSSSSLSFSHSSSSKL
jgi:hypothetical protein